MQWCAKRGWRGATSAALLRLKKIKCLCPPPPWSDKVHFLVPPISTLLIGLKEASSDSAGFSPYTLHNRKPCRDSHFFFFCSIPVLHVFLFISVDVQIDDSSVTAWLRNVKSFVVWIVKLRTLLSFKLWWSDETRHSKMLPYYNYYFLLGFFIIFLHFTINPETLTHKHVSCNSMFKNWFFLVHRNEWKPAWNSRKVKNIKSQA